MPRKRDVTRALKIVRDLRLALPDVPTPRIARMFNSLEKILEDVDARETRLDPRLRKAR